MSAPPTTACSSRTIRPSTSWRRSCERRCRCSSRPRTTPGWCTSGMRSTFGVANWRCRFEDYAHASEQALRHARLAGQRRSDLFRLDSALAYGPRPADEALRTLDALLPENPHPVAAADARLAAHHARPLRRGSAARERGRPSGGASSPATTRSTSCSATSRQTAGDHESAAVHLRRFCDCAEARRPARLPLRPTRRCSAARSARSAATTRPSRSPSSAATSTRPRRTSSRRRSGGRCRRSSTRAAANTRRRSASPARPSRSLEPTDALNIQGDALCDLAEVLHAAGRERRSRGRATRRRSRRYERKHNLARPRRCANASRAASAVASRSGRRPPA